MVNRVNGNDYYDYSKLKMPDAADKTGNGEKFSLNYQRAQEEKEDEEKKDKAGEGEEAKITGRGQRTVMQSGVKLELSGNAQSLSDIRRESTVHAQAAGQGLPDMIRSWISGFIQAVKDFIYKVWNDETPQSSTADTMTAGREAAVQDTDVVQGAEMVSSVVENVQAGINEPERLTEEYLALKNLENLRNPADTAGAQLQREKDRDKEIQKYLRNGNLEQVLNLVTQNGQKTMAKNSTLLTYYDRTGKITPLSASDQERILHGDRNVKKL
ncbi:MAG: hypothetical protein K2J99_06090 [Lachnospiraceae bacterium]|nr:hypothetical protein [Lachnospiraceae bacterium]